MKYLLATCLVCVLFSCNKNGTVEPDEPEVEVRAGYSYYRIKNVTKDTLTVVFEENGWIGNTGRTVWLRKFYPNESSVTEVNCVGLKSVSVGISGRQVCSDWYNCTYHYDYEPVNVGGYSTHGLYDVVDRRVLDINLIYYKE